RVDPPTAGTTHVLGEGGRLADAIRRGFGEGLHDLGLGGVEAAVVLGESLGVDLGAHDDLAGLRFDDDDDRDEALFTQDASVLEVGVGDLADTGAVDVDEPDLELADDTSFAVLEVDDGAVLGEDRVLLGNPCVDRELRIGDEVTVFTVNGKHVPGLDDVVAVEQFARGGVTGDVYLRISLVNDVRTELGEAVDHAVDGVLVAGDLARGEDDGVALPHLDRVIHVGHAAQNGHRLAL